MICPACKNDMIVVEHKRIELDYCTHCKGVWFDSGELDLWLKSMGQADGNQVLGDILKAPEAESAEKVRKCPVCRQGMKKVTVGRQMSILIDACRRGDGLWFDGGELDLLLKELTGKPAEKPDAQPQVATFLSEVFQGRG
jgi:Zn-finger nucleic acid-binding protein